MKTLHYGNNQCPTKEAAAGNTATTNWKATVTGRYILQYVFPLHELVQCFSFQRSDLFLPGLLF
jgi:hypothetical protein